MFYFVAAILWCASCWWPPLAV